VLAANRFMDGLYPIIRRKRRPLVEPEPEKKVPVLVPALVPPAAKANPDPDDKQPGFNAAAGGTDFHPNAKTRFALARLPERNPRNLRLNLFPRLRLLEEPKPKAELLQAQVLSRTTK